MYIHRERDTNTKCFPFEDALIGIRDLFLKYPAELKLHKYAVMEKLRERISDNDRVVRETLYQLLKSVVFPGCKEVTLVIFSSLNPLKREQGLVPYSVNTFSNVQTIINLCWYF